MVFYLKLYYSSYKLIGIYELIKIKIIDKLALNN